VCDRTHGAKTGTIPSANALAASFTAAEKLYGMPPDIVTDIVISFGVEHARLITVCKSSFGFPVTSLE
jgi:hypothetical protein